MHPTRPSVIEADLLAAMKAEAAALAREIDDPTIARLVVRNAARRAVERLLKEWRD
jgi:hypothetical protein